VITAIKDMWVRGAPLIGATAAWGMYLSTFDMPGNCERDFYFEDVYRRLLKTRPTAVNLKWALDEMLKSITGNDSLEESRWYAKTRAAFLCDADVEANNMIGNYGVNILENIYQHKKQTVQILTHCNAGWLATVDWGTATAPLYLAKEKGIPMHVWVSETRPRNQGANLTAWELANNGIAHTVIADNTSGYIMHKQLIDIVITGADRISRRGDVCNKIGTYMKAVLAHENNVPFYVAAPSSSIDFAMQDAFSELIIEERNPDEIHYVHGLHNGRVSNVRITPAESQAKNYAFDISPAVYITGIITERGICDASEEGLQSLFPEKMGL